MGKLISQIAKLQDYEEFENLNWTGGFEDYLGLVKDNPGITRTAFERVYDMVLSHGVESYSDNKKKLLHYSLFDDPLGDGKDAIYGLDIPLMRLVNVLKSAAMGYGTEKRVILLHGPVGSSKSTIARILKKGLEAYSRTPEGALYTYEWHMPESLLHITGGEDVFSCPMNEDPLRLIPSEWRNKAFQDLGLHNGDKPLKIKGDLNPACRLIFREAPQALSRRLEQGHGACTRKASRAE